MKKILFLFFLLLFFPHRTYAASSNFITDYSVTYNVMENALTHVAFDISLTNKTSQYYASSFSVQVGFENIENALAKDNLGKISPNIKKNDNGNNIEIIFNDSVVGLNKKLNFSISFDTKNIVQKSGKIWDINIPGLAEQNTYNSFNATVVVPKFLDTPSYVKPDTGKLINGNMVFTKDELGESGISIAYGKEQYYKFDLLYHLKNSNLYTIRTEIALPPSTNYQDVQISSINPKPLNVTIDRDGNWLAQYVLISGEKKDIRVKGHAKLMLNPIENPESESDLAEYLKPQQYWETNSKEIKDLAAKLKTPDKIFQYVVNTLIYDFNRTTNSKSRIGALAALKNPSSAVCLEFTDLFIAIARAANIPAREVNGFAFTQNSKERPLLAISKDVLHAWPEYYDEKKQTWIMVDPTWSNTTGGVDYFNTLDFDHFVFVKKGTNSTYPVPAGGYKITKSQKAKDITVTLTDKFTPESQTLTLSQLFSDKYSSLFAPKGKIVVRNNSHIVSSPQELIITTKVLKPFVQKITFGKIPPFGFVEIPVSFNRPAILTNTSDTIKIAINENYISKNINISPFIMNEWTILGGAILVIFIISISIIIFRSGHLPLFR